MRGTMSAKAQPAAKSATTSVTRSVALCTTAYVVAGCVALGVGTGLRSQHPIVVAAVADIAATIVVFLFSTAFRNSSFYDPYWSVAPIPIAIYWYLSPAVPGVSGVRQAVVLGLVSLWAVRLTYNWLRRWEGLSHEDWRYSDFRTQYGRAYWLIDLSGIHMFPTLIVLLGCLALYPALSSGTTAFGIVDLMAIVVTAGAIAIETIADKQLWRFLATKRPGQTLSSGLWAYSRHPNYFGEILFWWGLFLFGLAADPRCWWTIAGPIAMTVMFVFISVPLIDARSLQRRPGYAAHMRKVAAIVPWFPRA